jgi:hypothetical protein
MATSRAEGQVVHADVAGRRYGTAIAVLALAAVAVVALAVATSPAAAGRIQSISLVSWAALAAILAGGVAIIGVGRFGGEGYLASLWVFAPLAPAFAAGVSVVAYLLAPVAKLDIPANPGAAVAIGIGTTMLAWAASAFPGSALASRRRAQMRAYDALIQRCGVLESRVRSERARVTAEGVKRRDPHAEKALEEAECRLGAVSRELAENATAGPKLRWVLASGYTGLRRELHRVEEALYSVESEPQLVGDVIHDDLSLEDSGLRNRFTLRRMVRDALGVVSPGASHTLLRPVPALPAGSSLAGAAAGDAPAGPVALTKAEAREALREVRFAINDYRDDIMDSFALSRNKLIWTFLAVAMTTYALLALGMLFGVPKTALVSVCVLYLVGSLVGLFNRLRIESSRSSTVEDYGLYLARLVTGAVLSGLAGVAGVYLIAQAPAFLGPLTTTAAASVQDGQPFQVVQAPKNLADVYDLTTNQLALFIAAVFGLAPGTLTARLQAQVDRLERDLQRSEPATSKSRSGSTSSDEEGG